MNKNKAVSKENARGCIVSCKNKKNADRNNDLEATDC
jgi:hypothetical protein